MRTTRIACSLLVGAVLDLLLVTAASAVPRRVFVTSVSGNGRLGDWPDAGAATGLAAGDAICRARAAAGGLPNAATYRAWLSTSATDAFCHVHGLNAEKKITSCGGVVMVAYGPWYQTNGVTAVTPSLSDLTAAADRVTYSPIALDEYGLAVSYEESFAWTGTEATGVADEDTCNGWISGSSTYEGRFGSAVSSGDQWTDMNRRSCDNLRHLICFEPGSSDPFEPKWSPGRLAFVTSTVGPAVLSNWAEAGGASGLAAGDAVCRARAAAGHLPAPSSFFAWLSTDTVDAESRLSGTGAYRRVDGFTVASSKADLLDGVTTNSIHVDESGSYFMPYTSVWTGTTGSGTASSLNCVNWTSTSVENGVVGSATLSRDDAWTSLIQVGCTGSTHLYCFSNTYVIFWDGFDYTGDTGRWSSVAP